MHGGTVVQGKTFELEHGPDKETVEVGDELVDTDFIGRCKDLAKELVGTLLIHEADNPIGGVIVETEAYLGQMDPSCHLSGGPTRRTKPFLGGAGTVYVFKIFRHHNLNLITEFEGHPECILIRALHPTHGIDTMRLHRGLDDLKGLTTGPGRLTQALGITKEAFNDKKLSESRIRLYRTSLQDRDVQRTPRIGISKAQRWHLRYTFDGDPFLSRRLQPDDVPDDTPITECYEQFQRTSPRSWINSPRTSHA